MAVGQAPVLELWSTSTPCPWPAPSSTPRPCSWWGLPRSPRWTHPYLMHVGSAAEANLTVEQVQDVLVAVAPVVGAPRVLSAAQKITEVLGMTIAVMEAATADPGAES